MNKSDSSFKIIVLGEAGVGKSSLLRRFTQGTFSSRTTTTVGVDRIPVKISVDSQDLQFQVLDTSGSFGFRGLIKSYMTNIDAVVFMYDISNKESFASLPLWTTLLKNAMKHNITKVLVGNKRDLAANRRQVKFKNAKNYAEFEGMISMEISVKEEESVDLVFQCIARELKLKRQLVTESLDTTRASMSERLERKVFRSMTPVNNDFIESDDAAGNSPKQFVRKLSLMITGRNKRDRERRNQRQRKDSAPDNSLYNTSLFNTEKNTDEKLYLLW